MSARRFRPRREKRPIHTRGVNLNWHTHSCNTKCIDAYENREHIYLSST